MGAQAFRLSNSSGLLGFRLIMVASKKIASAAATFGLSVLLSGCGGGDDDAPVVDICQQAWDAKCWNEAKWSDCCEECSSSGGSNVCTYQTQKNEHDTTYYLNGSFSYDIDDDGCDQACTLLTSHADNPKDYCPGDALESDPVVSGCSHAMASLKESRQNARQGSPDSAPGPPGSANWDTDVCQDSLFASAFSTVSNFMTSLVLKSPAKSSLGDGNVTSVCAQAWQQKCWLDPSPLHTCCNTCTAGGGNKSCHWTHTETNAEHVARTLADTFDYSALDDICNHICKDLQGTDAATITWDKDEFCPHQKFYDDAVKCPEAMDSVTRARKQYDAAQSGPWCAAEVQREFIHAVV